MDIIETATKYLGSYHRECSANWRFICPTCGADKLYVNPKKPNGPFLCNGCGITGSVYSLAKKHGDNPVFINVEQEEINVNWKLVRNIYSKLLSVSTIRHSHIEWLNSRGIQVNQTNMLTPKEMLVRSSDMIVTIMMKHFTEQELEEAGILVNKDGKYRSSGIVSPNRIIIPYLNENGRCIYIRSRFAGICDNYRFLSPPKVPGRDFSWGWDTFENEGYVIITEGELKAQSAKQLGYQCIALPGMQTGHQALASKCKEHNIKKAYIMFDSEAGRNSLGIPKQKGVDRCAQRLADELKKVNITTYNCSLPLLGKNKMDIDLFVLLKGDSATDSILKVLEKGTRM